MEIIPSTEANKTVMLENIERENRYYRSIIEHSSFYIIITDLEGKYSYLNSFFCRKMQIEARDYIGHNALSLILPEDQDICIQAVQKCIIEPNEASWVVLRRPGQNGILYTQWEFKLMLDDHMEPLEILCVGHDITPHIIRQDELQELSDIKAEENSRLVNFTYIVSHNIRSHVANIIGIVNLHEDADSVEREIAWEMIKRSSGSLNETLVNLNEIISIRTNADLPLGKIYPAQEIEKVITAIPVLLSNAHAAINYNISDKDAIRGNSGYFESILLNLFTNAIKYKMPDKPLQVDISFEKIQGYCLITFEDNGIGIDLKKYGDDLFKMYKTFHGNQDAKGMGLFMIKSQLEAMKGKIEVESKVDQGTTFKLYFVDV